MKKSDREIRCLQCGVSATAGCDCNVGYFPKEKCAEIAIEREPGMSDSLLSEKYNVSRRTLGRIRKHLIKKHHGQNAHAARRTGKDNKSYPASPKRKKKPPPEVMVLPLDVQFEFYLGNLARHSAILK